MNLIKERLLGRYPKFLQYCKESGKYFVNELDREDFITYRAEFSVSHNQIEQLKKILGFRDPLPGNEIVSPRNAEVMDKCSYVLKHRFANGYKVGDEMSYLRFTRYYQEIFDEQKPLNKYQVDTNVAAIGVLCDIGKYIHPELVRVPQEVVDRVQNFIEAADRTLLFFKEIFDSLKDIFVGTQITNPYFLKGMIKLHKLPYIIRKGYLTKSEETDINKEFEGLIADLDRVSTKELREKFVSYTDAGIYSLISRCPNIIRIGDGRFMHSSHLNLRKEDYEAIRKFLRQSCKTPVSSRILLEMFSEHFAGFMTRNNIQSHNELFGILSYMFSKEFNFSRRYVSVTNIRNISTRGILLQILSDADEITIEDLVGICEENGIAYSAKTSLFGNLTPEFVRVDKETLKRPQVIGVTDNIVAVVAKKMQTVIERHGGWLVAKNFKDYEWLPQLESPWNGFLLESILTLSHKAPRKLKIPAHSPDFCPTIFLSAEFAAKDFDSFLRKVLVIEHAKNPFRSGRDIAYWLKEQGFGIKTSQKLLDCGRAFKLLKG